MYLQVTEKEANVLEKKTQGQSKSLTWFDERKWRLTASRFGDICNATARRNMQKLCKSLLDCSKLNTPAILHGQQYEKKAIKKFEEKMDIKVKPAGLFICIEKPFLAATPDGVIDETHIIEVKCPYSGRQEKIVPGKLFPFLYWDEDKIRLKPNSKYFYQVQGQLFVSKRKFCYFIVFTFKDLFVEKIEIDNEYCQFSIVPKLELFYFKHFRKYIAGKM